MSRILVTPFWSHGVVQTRDIIADQATEQLPRHHLYTEGKKKADVAEHPEVFDHVGLLVNELSSDTGVLFV